MDRTLLSAVLTMSLGMSLIPLGDTFGKAIMSFGVLPVFVAFARYVVGAAALLPFTNTASIVPLMRDWRVWFRSSLQVGAILSILTGLQTETLANAFGAFFAGPLISYLLSAALLGEKITWPRTVLLIIGFAGVLLVVKPGFAMTPGLAFAGLGGIFYGAFLTASRWLSGIGRSQDLMVTQFLIGSLLIAPLGLAQIPEFTPWLIFLIAGSGLSSMLGNLLILMAYRHATASILAPFVYVQLISAAILSFIIFGDIPDAIAATGITLIILSGLATLVFNKPKES
jgi:drug/metabolite transporter (DMT)-like permease